MLLPSPRMAHSDVPCSAVGLQPGTMMQPIDLTILGLSHDLRQPITAAKGWVQYLGRYVSRDGEPDEEIGRVIAAIDAAMNQLQVLLDETLAHMCPTLNGSSPVHRQPTDLVELIESVASEAQMGTDEHRIAVHAEHPTVLEQWDSVQLRRIFTNLLSNAVKYSLEGGEILVAIDTEPAEIFDANSGPMAVVRVHDRGVGISPSDLPYIFEPFYRGKNVADRTTGSGIGLSTLRQIVVLHHGDVSVESRPGGGVTFTVRLPLCGASHESNRRYESRQCS